MTIDQVLKHFGGISEVAAAVGISYQAVYQWVENGAVPKGRQWEIQALTSGELQAGNNGDVEAA